MKIRIIADGFEKEIVFPEDGISAENLRLVFKNLGSELVDYFNLNTGEYARFNRNHRHVQRDDSNEENKGTE